MTQILYQSQLEDKLRRFRLSGMVKALATRLKQAEAGNVSYIEFLGLLLEDEVTNRADNKRLRLYKAAKLSFEKGLEDFDFTFQPSINKREIIDWQCASLLTQKRILCLSARQEPERLPVADAVAAVPADAEQDDLGQKPAALEHSHQGKDAPKTRLLAAQPG